MTAWGIFIYAWDWEPSIVLGCAAMMVAYLVATRFRLKRTTGIFALGVLMMLVALVSPIDVLGDSYLFSAHMLQHLILILIVPPLLIVGTPRWMVHMGLRWRPLRRAEQTLSRPLTAWLAGVLTLWVWHLPVLYNAALANEDIHIFEHLCFLVSASIFWWPVLAPVEDLRLPPLFAAAYVFAGCVADTLLAIVITFAPVGLYPAYLHPVDTLGILPLLRGQWGLTAAVDQQVGGLLMWVPSCFVYLTIILSIFVRWYQAPEADEFAIRQGRRSPLPALSHPRSGV